MSRQISVSYVGREYDPSNARPLWNKADASREGPSRREEAMNVDPDQVFPNILVGACPRTAEHIDQLKNDFGITAILNLQTEEDFDYWGVNWEALAAHYRDSGIVVCRTPVRDFDANALRRNLAHCVESLDELLRDGHTVYVHCTAGINRSPSTVIAYLLWVEKWDWDRAVDQVTSRHKCDPYLDVISLATEDQMG
jgi:protein-tyrosine phosphatase